MGGLTIVIPVYNEEELIGPNTERLAAFLKTLRQPFEIIIGDNGSTDSTPRKGTHLAKKYPKKIKFFSVKKKGAVGTIFKTVALNSSYEKIISVDMDLSTDLNFIPRCLKLLDKYSMVIGSKKVGTQNRPLIRKIFSSVFIRLVKIFLGLDFSDYSLSCKGYRKSAIRDKIHHIEKGSSYVIALAYLLKREGREIKEIPVLCDDRRKSKFNLLDETIYRLRNLLTLWFKVKINRL